LYVKITELYRNANNNQEIIVERYGPNIQLIVGEQKFNNYGNLFIEVIQSYLQEHSSISAPSKTSSKKEDTKILSYNLYKEGKTIDEIANIRDLTKQTVETHLLKCYENNLDIDLEKDIHTEYKDIIYDAIAKIGYEKLKPLKDILPEDVSYMDIKYYIINFEREKK